VKVVLEDAEREQEKTKRKKRMEGTRD